MGEMAPITLELCEKLCKASGLKLSLVHEDQGRVIAIYDGINKVGVVCRREFSRRSFTECMKVIMPYMDKIEVEHHNSTDTEAAKQVETQWVDSGIYCVNAKGSAISRAGPVYIDLDSIHAIQGNHVYMPSLIEDVVPEDCDGLLNAWIEWKVKRTWGSK